MSTSSKIIIKLIALLILCAPFVYALSVTHGGQVIIRQKAATSNVELGYSTIGGTSISRDNYRRINFTTTDAVTITYGYFYGLDTNTDGYESMSLGIYDTSHNLVGTCSSSTTINSATPQWWEFTFSPGVSLSASTDYHLQYHCSGNGYVTYYYDTTATAAQAYGQAACGSWYTTGTSTRIATMTVANYDAH